MELEKKNGIEPLISINIFFDDEGLQFKGGYPESFEPVVQEFVSSVKSIILSDMLKLMADDLEERADKS